MPIYGSVFEPGILLHQMAGVLGGLFLILLGVAIFYTIAYWARRGRRVEGEVIGVRCRGGQFHSVYRYPLLEIGFREATSVQGSSSLDGRGTGTRRIIRVLPEHPEEAREPAAPVIWALACGLVLGGGWITWFNATTWKRSLFTWILFAVVAALLGRFVWRKLTRFLNAVQAKVGVAEPWDALPIENAERLGSIPQAPRIQSTNMGPIRAPMIFVVAGLVVLGTAYLPAHKLIVLRSGTRTEGTVLWLNEDATQRGGYSKFPEVQFTDRHGEAVRFLDKVGADPSPYHVGDKVPVLYQPDKQGSAMIDHGRGNWESVVALMVLGTTLLGVGLLASRGSVIAGSQTRPAGSYSVYSSERSSEGDVANEIRPNGRESRKRMMDICTQCGTPRTDRGACASCGASQPAVGPTQESARVSQAPNVPGQQSVRAQGGHLVRTVLLIAALCLVVIVGLGIARSVSAKHTAEEQQHELAPGIEATPARAAEVAAAIRGPQGTSGSDATDQSDPGASSFPAWQSSATSAAGSAPPRAGMLVVTAIADVDGDYESLKQIESINADGITITYHGEKPKGDGHVVANVSRLVLAKDQDTSHKYAELFGKNQPRSFPGTTAITASKEVLTELSQKGSSQFSFQPDGMRGAIGNMVNILKGFGGLSNKDLGGDKAIESLSQDECVLTREGSGLFAFPVLLENQPTTLPAVRAGCSTDDGPAEFYILNQPEYPLMLSWKLGSGSQLQVTKISYPPASAKSTTAAASSQIDQQLQENKKVEIYGIYFDFGSDQLKPESTAVLDEIAAVLGAHADWKLNVSGHTDNIGGDDSNLDLSKRRAAAVKASLVANHHIAPSRLETDGFGASRPVDTNATLAGRARNRRVELVRQ